VSESSLALKDLVLPAFKDTDEFEDIYIIPDGAIWDINFSSIPLKNKQIRETLGLYSNITYQYSYYHNDLLAQATEPLPSPKVIAFSSYSANEVPIKSGYARFRQMDSDLPGTSVELQAIDRLTEGDFYYSDQSKESYFKSLGDNFAIVHLSLHGLLDNENPGNSSLHFIGKDSLEDGFLHAREIYNLQLNAELAVLSACHSGTGKINQGQGLMSLGRAFIYAGSQSVLLSRWEVSDVTAPVIMKYFYEGLVDGLKKSEALRKAKLQQCD